MFRFGILACALAAALSGRSADFASERRVLARFADRLGDAGAVEFRACDNDVIPSPERLAEADLIAGLEEIYDTERNLLYVACTRARDYLLVTSSGVPSELLMDMAERS